MSEVSRVTLKQLVEITSTLANIVSKSYGPRCQSSLLATSTGTIMVTTDGIKLLQSLCVGHPVAKVIIQAVENHHANYGDGVKTFLLYLKEFLKFLSSSQSETVNFLQTVSRKIGTFSNQILSKCLRALLCENVVCLDSNCDIVDTCRHLTFVIKSTLSPHFNCSQSKIFSQLIVSSLTSDMTDLSRILDRVALFSDYFQHLHKTSKQAYASSKVIPGILIRDFTGYHHDFTNSDIKFIILRNSIQGIISDEPEETIHISMETNMTSFFTRQATTSNDFLRRLVSEGVELVLTNQKLPQYVISLCTKYKISVIGYLDDEELNFLEKLSSVSSMSSVNDDFSGYNIGETSLCQRVKYSGRYYVNLNFKNTSYVNSYLLCAPTDGLCFELSTLIYKSVKTLLVASNRNCKMDHNDCFVKIIQNSVAEMCKHELDSSGLTADSNQRLVLKEITSDSLTIKDDVLFNNNQERLNKEHFTPINQISPMLDTIERDKILLIPAGGCFEFQLMKAIKKTSKDLKDVGYTSLCKIIGDMLLSVPRALHNNTSVAMATEQRHCVQVLHQILDSAEPRGLNSKGVAYNPDSSCEIFESFYLKVGILYNVLQLVQQLSRLDMIIGVKKI